MLPIFKEYADFIYAKTGLKLEDNTYWYDNSIIKAFDENGKLYKVYRLKIDDDLNMSYSQPKRYRVPAGIRFTDWGADRLQSRTYQRFREPNTRMYKGETRKIQRIYSFGSS